MPFENLFYLYKIYDRFTELCEIFGFELLKESHDMLT